MTFDQIDRAVAKLKPVPVEGGDRILRIYCCNVLLGKTKVSRKQGRRKDVGPHITAQLPKQLKISRDLWERIASCHASRPEYLAARDHAGHE